MFQRRYNAATSSDPELTIFRHPQQPAARSRRRSGPRERVRDPPTTPLQSAEHLDDILSPYPEAPPIPLHSICACLRYSQLLAQRIEEFATDKRTVKDKANHAVVLDKQTADKLNKDVQSYRLITVATLVDRLKINGSLAREALADLEEKGQIKKVVGHSKLSIYSTLRPSILLLCPL